MEYKKIMVTLDGSTFAAQALPHAEALAALHQAELILLEVVPDASSPAQVLGETRNIMHIDERQEHFIDEATQKLEDLAEELHLRQIKATPVIKIGHPAATIIDYAKEAGVDVIVMSTHGRTGLARWVYGSVADKVLKAAPCPVLLVRAKLDSG